MELAPTGDLGGSAEEGDSGLVSGDKTAVVGLVVVVENSAMRASRSDLPRPVGRDGDDGGGVEAVALFAGAVVSATRPVLERLRGGGRYTVPIGITKFFILLFRIQVRHAQRRQRIRNAAQWMICRTAHPRLANF